MKHEYSYNSDSDDAEDNAARQKDMPPRFRAPILPPTLRPEAPLPEAVAEVPVDTAQSRKTWIPLQPGLMHETVLVRHDDKEDDDDDDEEEEKSDARSTAATTPPVQPTRRTEHPAEAVADESEDATEEPQQPATPAHPIVSTTPPLSQPELRPVQAAEHHEDSQDEDIAQPATPHSTPSGYQTVAPQPRTPDVHAQEASAVPIEAYDDATPPTEAIPTLHIPEEQSPLWQPEAASPFDPNVGPQNPNAPTPPPAAGGGGKKPPTVPPTTHNLYAAGYPNMPPQPHMQYGYNAAPPVPVNLNTYNTYHTSVVNAPEQHTTVEARDRRVSAIAVLLGAEYFLRRRMGRQIRQEMQDLANKQHKDALRTTTQLQERNTVLSQENARQQRAIQELEDRQAQQERYATPLTYGSEQTTVRPSAPFERPLQGPRSEQGPVQPERQQPTAEQVEAQAASLQESQPRQHVEQDAWRRYVVDEHGREIQGAVTYGEAYHQERQREIRRDLVSDDTAGLAATSVGGVIMHGQQVQHPTLPSGMTNTALPQGKPSTVDPQHRLPEPDDESFSSNLTNPWFWVMLGLIVAAFFTAALI